MIAPLDSGTLLSDISVMTEINENGSKLSPAATEFVLHWGNLGGQWGVNRSVAQIHALLFISDRPLHAEEVADMLGLARSNVSNSIKELLNWRLIARVPLLGDRRDHFSAEKDIWEMITRIAAGRKAREVDPAEAALKACVARAADDPQLSAEAKARLTDMLDFVTTMSSWYDEMLNVPKPALMRLIKLGAGVTKLITWRPGKSKDVH